jgi:hypothetical protein
MIFIVFCASSNASLADISPIRALLTATLIRSFILMASGYPKILPVSTHLLITLEKGTLSSVIFGSCQTN